MNEKARGPYLILDFDSTIIRGESLDELAVIALRDHRDADKIMQCIRDTTTLGMEGTITISESLKKRIELLHAKRTHFEELIPYLLTTISPSFYRNRNFLKTYNDNIYVISNGFKEIILPVVRELHIREDHVFGNTFVFDEQGTITGYDETNVLAHPNGKGKILKSLGLNGEVCIIGDSFTDLEMKKSGLANSFFAFTENVTQDGVVAEADHVIRSFDEVLHIYKLPRQFSFPKSKMTFLLLDNIHPDAAKAFRDEGFHVEVESSLTEDQLYERLKGVSVLGIRTKTEITERVLEHADRLLAIGAFSVGTNNVNLKACARKGVAVFNSPFSNTRSVAELAVGNIIALLRGIFDKSMKMHQGIWDKSVAGSHEIRGKKLGIIGYGNIGAQLSIMAEAMGMEVRYYDVVEKLAIGNVKKCSSIQELLEISDVVSLHVDGNLKRTLIGAEEIAMMKEGAVFINLSRGFLVDIPALANALKQKKLKGAALDVFPQEPKSNKDPFVSELRGLPNVILTPHIGGSTEEAQQDIARYTSVNIRNFINNGSTTASVNFPQIHLSEVSGAHRFIHIHKNVPGKLAQINSALASHNINIISQYLKTNEDIGYVITDVDARYEETVVDDLKAIPDTIRVRVLY